jgi:excisionase family DNA binding protein
MRTSTGLPFDEKAVRWLRWRYRIGPSQPRDGELTVTQIAERFGISDGTVYAWIATGKLAARRGPANRLYIPRKSASSTGSITSFVAAWTTRSRTAGTVASNCTSCSPDFVLEW